MKRKLLVWGVGVLLSTSLFANNSNMPDGWPWKGVDTMASVMQQDNHNVVDFILSEKIQHVRIHIFLRNTMKRMNISAQEALEVNLQWSKELYEKLHAGGVESYLTIADFPVTLDTCIDKKLPEYWRNETCTNQIKSVAEQTVEYFKNTDLLGYQFMAEPVVTIDGTDQLPTQWRALNQEMINKTRALGDDKYILYAHSTWGGTNGYDNFIPFNDDKIIYTAHIYDPHQYTHQSLGTQAALNNEPIDYPGTMSGLGYVDKSYIKSAIHKIMEFTQKYNKPLLISEFSTALWAPNSEQYTTDLIDIFNEQSWGWTYFNVGSPYYHGWDARFIGTINEDGTKAYHYLGADAPRYSAVSPYLKDDVNVSVSNEVIPVETVLTTDETRLNVNIEDIDQSVGGYCAFVSVKTDKDINDWNFKLHLPSTIKGIWGVDSDDLDNNNHLVTSQNWSRLLSNEKSHRFKFCGLGYAGDISIHDTKGHTYEKYQTKIFDKVKMELSAPTPNANGYCATVKLTNITDHIIKWLSVELEMPDSTYTEGSGWGADYSTFGSDEYMYILSKSWNENIAVGASRTVGFCATGRNNIKISSSPVLSD